MFGTILVGTDGSGSATRAVDLAARLAARTGSTLLAISVYGQPLDGSPLRGPEAGGIDVARGLLEDVQKHHGNSVTLETIAVAGDAAESILRIATERKVGLIVTGDRGMSGAHRVLGSVPNTITHHAPCDVLIAHTADGTVGELTVTTVLLATDGTETATRAVTRGLAVADALEATPVLMTAGSEDAGAKILEATRTSLGRDLTSLVKDMSPADAILAAADEVKADLIVTGSRGMTGARRLLGSVPNSVSHHVTSSMLIVKTT